MRKFILIPNSRILNINEDSHFLFLRHWQIDNNIFNNYEIAEHPWRDYEKLRIDNLQIEDLYSRIIENLVNDLNTYHNTKYSDRSWKVILGPWLYNFIGIIFERYENLKYVFEHYKIEKVYFKDISSASEITKNYNSFTKLALSHKWNESIYIDLINYFFSIKIEENKDLYYANEINLEKNVNDSNNLIKLFTSIYSKLINTLLKNKGVMFFGSNISKKDIIKFSFLNKSLPILPIIPIEEECTKKLVIDSNFRKSTFDFNSKNKFETYISTILFKHLPFSFVEKFHYYDKYAKNIFGENKRLKYIITASGYYNDLFTFYLANSINKNIKIIGLQHGGAYGSILNSYNENHEISVTDKFLSWGWKKNNSNVVPFYFIKKIINKNNNILKNYCTIFLNGNDIYSLRVSNESYIHNINPTIDFDSIVGFINRISNINGIKILFRGYPFDYGWNDKNYIEKKHGKKILYNESSNIDEIFNMSKILIFNINSTGYLESLVSNFPTILILTKERKIRSDAMPYFNLLKKNNILFDNFMDAAEHINNIYYDINKWWYSKELQNDIKVFTQNFVLHTDNIAIPLNKTLKNL